MGATAEAGGIGKGVGGYWWTSVPYLFHSEISAAGTKAFAVQGVALRLEGPGTGGAEAGRRFFCRFVFLHPAATAGRVLNEEVTMKEVAFFVQQADPDEHLEEDNPL